MSATNSSNSPGTVEAEVEEPRKKGARGGKRSVTHLSKAQLARKRANDREAQRNIRQRTKEHIENLEKKIGELEGGGRSSSMERILNRNMELEEENERLRAQITQQANAATLTQAPQVIPEGFLTTQKADTRMKWMPVAQPERPSGTWAPAALPSCINDLPPVESQISEPPYIVDGQLYPPKSGSYDGSADSPEAYTKSMIPVWDDSQVFDKNSSLTRPEASVHAWAPFHPSLSQPSRFADLPSGLPKVINTPSYTETNCWQSQPSVYAWQISTKLKAPVTHVDQLMLSVIHSQRHLHITSDLGGEDLVGPEFPPVHILFNQPGPMKRPSTLTEVMARYAAVLSNRGFALIPEKLASFMCMYRFVQWQISPTFIAYQALHDWQAPVPAQLMIAHPAWMDLPPWPKFREKVITNQDCYDNIEFQNDYASNLSVNFPYDPMKALVFEEGQIRVSKMLEMHLSNLANMSMKKPFAEKYPEFRDVCRFDEV